MFSTTSTATNIREPLTREQAVELRTRFQDLSSDYNVLVGAFELSNPDNLAAFRSVGLPNYSPMTEISLIAANLLWRIEKRENGGNTNQKKIAQEYELFNKVLMFDDKMIPALTSVQLALEVDGKHQYIILPSYRLIGNQVGGACVASLSVQKKSKTSSAHLPQSSKSITKTPTTPLKSSQTSATPTNTLIQKVYDRAVKENEKILPPQATSKSISATRKLHPLKPPPKDFITKKIAHSILKERVFEDFQGNITTNTAQKIWEHRLEDYTTASFEVMKLTQPYMSESLDQSKGFVDETTTHYTNDIRNLREGNTELEKRAREAALLSEGFWKKERGSLTGSDGSMGRSEGNGGKHTRVVNSDEEIMPVPKRR